MTTRVRTGEPADAGHGYAAVAGGGADNEKAQGAEVKINDFKTELTASLKSICAEKHWSFDNAKLRGMAFENWCFNLFAERYPAADNDLEESIIRGDDGTIDVVFESKETEEIYILQCKHPKIAQNDPIPEEEVKAFFGTYNLLNDAEYLKQRKTNNQKISDLGNEFEY